MELFSWCCFSSKDITWRRRRRRRYPLILLEYISCWNSRRIRQHQITQKDWLRMKEAGKWEKGEKPMRGSLMITTIPFDLMSGKEEGERERERRFRKSWEGTGNIEVEEMEKFRLFCQTFQLLNHWLWSCLIRESSSCSCSSRHHLFPALRPKRQRPKGNR